MFTRAGCHYNKMRSIVGNDFESVLFTLFSSASYEVSCRLWSRIWPLAQKWICALHKTQRWQGIIMHFLVNVTHCVRRASRARRTPFCRLLASLCHARVCTSKSRATFPNETASKLHTYCIWMHTHNIIQNKPPSHHQPPNSDDETTDVWFARRWCIGMFDWAHEMRATRLLHVGRDVVFVPLLRTPLDPHSTPVSALAWTLVASL